MTTSVKEVTEETLVQSIQNESTADVASLALEGLHATVEATLTSPKSVVYASIQEKREEGNLILPVNQLPPEILENIFQECLWLTRLDDLSVYVYKYGTRIHHCVLLSLALVSKRWYGIVFGTPALWALISLTMPLVLVDKGLDLSVSHPLDILCETRQFSTGDGAMKASLLKFIEAVTPHLGRCRLLRVAFDGVWFPETQQMLSSPNETIGNLEIVRYSNLPQPDPITISLTPFQHQAPKLACIKIWGIRSDWRFLTRFPALQTLNLTHVTIPASQIDSGFNECLALRVLELHDVGLEVDVPAPGPFFDLPNLQTLVFTHREHYSPGQRVPLVISRIRSLRSLESLHLGFHSRYVHYDEIYFQANIVPSSSDFSRILGSATCIHIDSGEHTSITNTTRTFRLSCRGVVSDSLWHQFRDIISENGFSGNIHLSVRGGSLHNISEGSRGWPFLNVSCLTLEPEEGFLAAILKSLGGFLEDPQHWSTLRCIRLGFDEIHLDQLTACLKKRYSGTRGGSVEPQHINIQIKCWENGISGVEELKATHGVDSLVLEERPRNTLPKPWDDEDPTRFGWDLE